MENSQLQAELKMAKDEIELAETQVSIIIEKSTLMTISCDICIHVYNCFNKQNRKMAKALYYDPI